MPGLIFWSGMVVLYFRQLFLLVLFYFCQFFFDGDITYKLVVTLQSNTDEERAKKSGQ